MFNNVGRKIKFFAKIFLCLGTIASVVGALVYFVLAIKGSHASVVSGFLLLIVGPLSFWIISLFIYSWGEVVENVNNIAENSPQKEPNGKIAHLNNLLKRGLITKEEYNKALGKE